MTMNGSRGAFVLTMSLVLASSCVSTTPSGERADLGAGRQGAKREQIMMMSNLTTGDMEEIRNVVIAHYERQEQHESSRSFIPELKRGAIFLDEVSARIGIWSFENRAERRALVRQPPISAEMHYFGVYLQKGNQGWIVDGDFHKKERLDLGD